MTTIMICRDSREQQKYSCRNITIHIRIKDILKTQSVSVNLVLIVTTSGFGKVQVCPPALPKALIT